MFQYKTMAGAVLQIEAEEDKRIFALLDEIAENEKNKDLVYIETLQRSVDAVESADRIISIEHNYTEKELKVIRNEIDKAQMSGEYVVVQAVPELIPIDPVVTHISKASSEPKRKLTYDYGLGKKNYREFGACCEGKKYDKVFQKLKAERVIND